MTLEQLRQRQEEIYQELQINGFNNRLVSELNKLSIQVSNALKQRKKYVKDYKGVRIDYKHLRD